MTAQSPSCYPLAVYKGQRRVMMQACRHYHAMLQNVYGEEAVLKPHVMPVEVLNISDAAGDTAQFPF